MQATSSTPSLASPSIGESQRSESMVAPQRKSRPDPCQPNVDPCVMPSTLPIIYGPPATPLTFSAPSGPYYDVPDTDGGPTLNNVTEHLIVYTNGYPQNNAPSAATLTTFAKDLSTSTFLQEMLSEYTLGGKGTFTFAGAPAVTSLTAVTGTATDNGSGLAQYYDEDAITADLEKVAGSNVGPNYLYSIILPTDLYYMCHKQNAGTTCIANAIKDDFCANHDIWQGAKGPIFYTLEHGWPACTGYDNWPNWQSFIYVAPTQLEESMLLHEIVESISDPYWDGSPAVKSSAILAEQQSSAWTQPSGEVADVCEDWISEQNFSGNEYQVQPIWSNRFHKCYYVPWMFTPPVGSPIALSKHHK
jgi:hypothetical protein